MAGLVQFYEFVTVTNPFGIAGFVMVKTLDFELWLVIRLKLSKSKNLSRF
ncbi:MAG: hypothetical protein WCS03_12085 [Bacteroidota bacterium]